MVKMSKETKVKNEEIKPSKPPVVPPDGGWGWVVVFSSLMCNILVDGIGLAYGVLLPKFAEYFQASKSKVSLVGSIMVGMYLCAGPIVSFLVQKFGCRAVTIAGSILSSCGFLLGSFSPNLDILILTYGFIGGLGFGMIYLPSIVSVGFYFEKRRPLATGIAVCGSGIGTFIFSPLLEYLSEVYDWKNLLFILAGVSLNGIVFGMLMRPLKNSKRKEEVESESDASSDSGIKVERRKSCTGDSGFDSQPDQFKSEDSHSYSGKDNSLDEPLSADGIFLREIEPFIQVNKATGRPRINRRSSSLNDLSTFQQNRHTSYKLKKPSNQHQIIYSGSVLNIPVFHSQPNITHSVYSLQNLYSERKTVWDRCTCLPPTLLAILREMLDFSILANIPFLLLFIGNIFATVGFFIPFYFLVDSALLLNIPTTEAAFLLSIIGVTNTVGRLLSGFIANLKSVDALVVNNIAMIVGSLALVLKPLCTVYPALIAFAAVFGLCIAAFVSLTSIILCDLLGLHRLANAFGLLTLARGIAGVAGPPIAGAVFQATGNYNASFYFGAGMFFVGALFHCALHLSSVKKLGKDEPEVTVEETYEDTSP